MDLDGNALELHGDLYHYSNPTMNSQLQKLEYFSDIFLQRQLDSGEKLECYFGDLSGNLAIF